MFGKCLRFAFFSRMVTDGLLLCSVVAAVFNWKPARLKLHAKNWCTANTIQCSHCVCVCVCVWWHLRHLVWW